MSKITLNDLTDLQNETTAVNVINSNSSTIETAFDNTLSRDGTSPNQMSSNLDMNSNSILNLPTPTSNFEPIRLIDASTLGSGGTITINPLPAGGTTGQSLVKNSSTNFDTSWQTTGTVPIGGSINQVLAKNSSANFDSKWINAVTSVAMTVPSDLTVTGSPITTTGTLALGLANTPTGTGGFVRQTSPTISLPQIAQITNAGATLTLPTTTDTVVGRATVDTLTNKTIGVTQLSGTIPAANMPAYVGDVTTATGGLVTTISAGAVTNGKSAQMAAYTLKGNSTAGLATPTDISIPSLTQKSSPISGDMVMIVDSAASNQLKFATVGSVATAGSVSSVGGLTGAITLGPGLSTSGSSILSDPAMIGEIRQLAFNRVPTNFLSCDGSQITIAGFPSLYAALVVSSVVTITNASPAVVTWTGNQLQNNDPILLVSSLGNLPAGLGPAIKYYVRNLSGNTFNLSATPGGTVITTSSAGSGVFTATNAPWEGTVVGNGSTTFTLPALNGYFVRGIDNLAGFDPNRSFGTPQTHQFQDHSHSVSDPGHAHPTSLFSNAGTVGFAGGLNSGATVINTGVQVTNLSVSTANAGNRGAETRPTNQALKYVVRYQ